MSQLTNTIVIEEYHEGLASNIAKMWNLSRDSWGGDTRVHTEEQVKTKEANSGNIALYLALDGEEVVGYCGLSEYKEDTGSLYIPLLNVRPDYHGMKIGKMLVLKALEKTVELGWPRLDLYTWPGNVKAVPLYKKCGFFWEDRDDTTHLMNFIPAVLNTPLLKKVFSKLDWYAASIREIEVKPDGVKQNGFTFYEYAWEKGQSSVRVRFERSGRGISLIETDEYYLELSMADHEVIEEEAQKVELKFVNKTNKPVLLKVQGNHHDRVEADFSDELLVDKEVVLFDQVRFKRGEDPSVWKTHPFFSVNVFVDDEECELRLGVFPKQPAKITAKAEGNLSFLGQTAVFELEVENSLKEDAVFELAFSENEHVQLDKAMYSLSLKKSERKLVNIPYKVKKIGFYQPNLTIKAIKADGTELIFESKHVGIGLKGFGEKFGGESKEYWHIYNGINQVNIRKMDHLITAGRNSLINQPFAFFVPKLGKPYSLEFSKQKDVKVEWYSDDTAITCKQVFRSTDFSGIVLTMYTSLYGEGMIKKWAAIENNGEELYKELYLNQSIYHEKKQAYFPLEGSVVEFSEIKEMDFGDVHSKSLSENWYFSNDNGEPNGFCWPEECKANLEGWQFYLEFELGSLSPGERKVINPSYLSIGALRTWQEQQAFASRMSNVSNHRSVCEKIFSLHGNNPVVQKQNQVPLQLKSYRTNFLEGSLEISLNAEKVVSDNLSQADEKTCYATDIPIKDAPAISIINGTLKSESSVMDLDQLLLIPRGEVNAYTEEKKDYTSYVLDNGIIRLKTAPDFYPGLYSLAFKDNEWFDTSFPERIAKGWWNPWAGGMKTIPSKLNAFSLLKEKTTAEFINLEDKHGNKWSSLAVHTVISSQPMWKGLHYTQYFALLPGVPAMAYFVKVSDSGGKSMIGETWHTDLFIKGDSLKDLSLSPRGNAEKYYAGIEEQLLFLKEASFISAQSREEKLYIVAGADSDSSEGYMNKEAFLISSVQTARKTTKPGFILFENRRLSESNLRNLGQIEF